MQIMSTIFVLIAPEDLGYYSFSLISFESLKHIVTLYHWMT